MGTYANTVNISVFERGDLANESFELEAVRCNFDDRSVWLQRKIDGEHFFVTETYRNFDPERSLSQSKSQVFVSENQELVVLEKIVRHLLSMLDAKVTVRITKQYEKPKELFIWKYIQRLEALKIQMIGDFGKSELSGSCGWEDFDIYPNHIKCKMLEYHLDGIPFQEVNKFFKGWMSGKLTNIDHICFWHPCIHYKNYDPIFEGLNAVPTTFSSAVVSKRRIVRHCYVYIVMDIKRNTDDLKATIVVSKPAIEMYVWHPEILEVCEKTKSTESDWYYLTGY
ncbi:hypothetical protein CAEBREN_24358 [Caenorhabditis brenneri]|uniref:F-box associated domain-containing protein n=1 Tax=Caenorhabditis brenneri TaxID=135651 RepID=G0MJH1_CAEBE|nr:hypothetical protein CAEBREN_24358 [Caenorhabditis brenneri]